VLKDICLALGRFQDTFLKTGKKQEKEKKKNKNKKIKLRKSFTKRQCEEAKETGIYVLKRTCVFKVTSKGYAYSPIAILWMVIYTQYCKIGKVKQPSYCSTT